MLRGLYILSLRRFGAASVFVSLSMTWAKQAMSHVWSFHVELYPSTWEREMFLNLNRVRTSRSRIIMERHYVIFYTSHFRGVNRIFFAVKRLINDEYTKKPSLADSTKKNPLCF